MQPRRVRTPINHFQLEIETSREMWGVSEHGGQTILLFVASNNSPDINVMARLNQTICSLGTWRAVSPTGGIGTAGRPFRRNYRRQLLDGLGNDINSESMDESNDDKHESKSSFPVGRIASQRTHREIWDDGD
jgi:hypothetical protein